MEHPEFARIIASFEDAANAALEEVRKAQHTLADAQRSLDGERNRANIAENRARELEVLVQQAGHKVAERIAAAVEHIHDADHVRKQAMLDAARIARGVHL